MMRLLVLLALLGGFGFAVFVLGGEISTTVRQQPEGSASRGSPKDKPLAAVALGSSSQQNRAKLAPLMPLKASNEIIQRPIFFHDRQFPKPRLVKVVHPKPPPAPPRIIKRVPPPKPPPPPPKFVGQLHGVVLTGPVRKALISSKGVNAEWFAQGQSVAGWLIIAISATSVELRHKGVTARVNLFDAPSTR